MLGCPNAKPLPTIIEPTLDTTPELYNTITDLLCKKPLPYEHRKMDFDPLTPPFYKTHIKELKKSGRMVNVTTADGNCLYRSLSKGLVGTEEYHYSVRCVLFGFISMNSNIFMPHIKQKHPGMTSINDYCSAMSNNGIWGTDIELLAASTILQVPIYTHLRNQPF